MQREGMPGVDDATETIIPPLGECDAADIGQIPPRGWLLGNSFCRKFVSSLLADGGVGKTALRIAQLLALATFRQLTGEHVFQRCRVLIVSLEDDLEELKRRLKAAMMYYDIIRAEDLRGWLFFCAPGRAAGKLATIGDKGQLVPGTFGPAIERVVINRKIDIVSIDPFVKAHSVEENGNSAVDDVMQILSEMASRHDIAIDVPHHVSKGASDPGNANRGRGATAMKDACRLVHTLTPMSLEEAQAFGIAEPERRRLIRIDGGKINIAPPMTEAKWFRLVGVRLGNETKLYPHGDEVQTVEPWTPPDTWEGISNHVANLILTEIDAGLADGNRYSDHQNVAAERSAWRVVAMHVPEKTEQQARRIIATWLKSGTLMRRDYENPATRKPVKGLFVNPAKRPS